ncbi:S1 family peptidase [Pontiella agarivorans]|uniref:Serine protease n=1 Tax=Pontiella agarivorans TaxID=3038953 RepID=A0ABU5MVE7_9BACT|nr:serine protease [Pontiella agarivorans]MDZ8117926.1 serine protease [Pontiella agarivorans]
MKLQKRAFIQSVICGAALLPGNAVFAENVTADDFDFSADQLANRLAVLTCSTRTESWFGSGFVAELNGKKYIFTNQHVILGADRITCKTADGQPLRPRGIELSKVRNLARFEVDTDAAFPLSSDASMDEAVAVFGNEKGTPTEYFGRINGVGADLIETTAEFTRENGGAPVLNADGAVIGMASHVRESRSHAMKEGTKFEDRTRRFCQRFNRVDWQTVNWKRFNTMFGKPYRQSEALINNTFDILVDWQNEPFKTVSLESGPDRGLNTWVSSHNAVMEKIVNNSNKRQKYSAYAESLQGLSEICASRARQLQLLEGSRELTGFLRNEFSAQAAALDFAVKYIKRRGDTIHTFSN